MERITERYILPCGGKVVFVEIIEHAFEKVIDIKLVV